MNYKGYINSDINNVRSILIRHRATCLYVVGSIIVFCCVNSTLRVLRKVFGAKRDEVTGKWRKLHIEELNDLYSLPNIVRVDKIETNEMGRACSAYGGG